MCKKIQCDNSQKTKIRYNKIKTFLRAGEKDSFQVIDNTYVCKSHFNITDMNVSTGRHRKKLKPNVVPSVFSFKKKSENSPRRRSPSKGHLVIEFVKGKRKKSTPEIIDAENFDLSLNLPKATTSR